jgi:hypothetical protein
MQFLDPKINQLNIKMFKCVVNLKKGSCFGELALINEATRAARVVCAKDCTFGVL